METLTSSFNILLFQTFCVTAVYTLYHLPNLTLTPDCSYFLFRCRGEADHVTENVFFKISFSAYSCNMDLNHSPAVITLMNESKLLYIWLAIPEVWAIISFFLFKILLLFFNQPFFTQWAVYSVHYGQGTENKVMF